jgi:hypothetical protein
VIDAHAQAFPRTRVFLNVGDYGEINDYAALRGCHFRQDGLKPSGPSANVGKRFYQPYSPRGVICNYEFHSSYRSMQDKGWDLNETLEAGLSDPISYLNTNIMNPKQWETAPIEVKALFEEAARRVGYRLVISEMRVPVQIHLRPGSRPRLLLEHHWKNSGVAPCHESYAIEFTLCDDAGQPLNQHVHYPQTPTSQWTPGKSIVEQTLIRLPMELSPGELRLKVAVFDPASDAPAIRLGIVGRDAENRYSLCKLEAIEGEMQGGSVYRETFEGSDHHWSAARGILLQTVTDQPHNGNACVLLEGRQQGAWNYAGHRLVSPVLAGSRYRLSCWMKIDRLNPADKRPYLKIGLNDAHGDWISNLSTAPYDMQQLGAWQKLQATIETPLNTAGGHLSVERGCKDQETDIRLWLDDVELELLEAP